MFLGKKPIVVILLLILLIKISGTAEARSVYVITDRDSTVKAYDIQDDQIEYQTDAENLDDRGSGAVGLALDPDSGIMFVTYEGSNVIEMVNAKSMVSLQNPVTVPGTIANGLSGIAFDQTKQKLYVLKRQDNRLYVYLWNPITRKLTLEGDTYKTLENIGTYPNGAYGIALDESNERLYVTDATKTVRFYDTNDPNFGYKGSIDIVVDTNVRKAIGIAIDPNRHYLYTGFWTGTAGDHTFLVRTDINDVNNPTFTEKNVGAYVIGISADEDTELVYITTSNNHIEVHNRATWESDPCDIETGGISGPADICLAGDVSYKPPLLTLSKIDDVNDGNCVSPGDEITYTIIYGPNGYDHNNVVITDYLPCEVDYENIFDLNYDYEKHTYKWEIGPLDANDPDDSVTLTVKVNQLAEPLGTLINRCEIESDIAYSTAEVNTPVCWWSPYIIYVDVDAVGSNSGLSWYHADPNLQRALEKAQAWDSNQIWVAAGTYKPTTEAGDYGKAFELVNGVDIYGGFAGNESAITQRNLMINETILDGNLPEYGVSYVVGANDVNETTIIDGFTITNGWWVGIYSVNSSLIIGHNRISDNGYGICSINWSSVNVTNCDIINNRGRTSVHGGGIYCKDSNDLTVTDCIISENTTDANGGGIYFNDSSSLIVMDCTITDNEAGKLGGGIYDSNSSSSAITDCTFSGNSADEGGGLLLYSSSSPNITNCIFTGNTATYLGGAMSSYCSSPTVLNCIFSGNYAGQSGGGICNAFQPSPAIINCTFSGNSAGTYYGGGMYNYESSPNITNCTFRGNFADANGGAMQNYESSPNVTNCIFWDNEAGTGGNEIYDANSDPNITYCDVMGGYEGTGNIDSDPLFYDSNDPNNYHLTSNSPCIDAGTNTPIGGLPTTDIDGEPRVVDGDANETEIVDMGADEYDYRDADFDNDGIVNFIDYAMFANTWQTDSNDPNYNDNFDLEDNNSIDYADLALFVEDWLWIAGWAQTEGLMMGQGMGRGFRLMEGLYLSAPAKQQPTQIKPLDIEEIINWLEELWLTDERARQVIDEDTWLKFMESIKEQI